MPCLEPGKELSEQEKEILMVLDKFPVASRGQIAEETNYSPPVISRKIRQLVEKELAVCKEDSFQITQKGKEAAEFLRQQKKD